MTIKVPSAEDSAEAKPVLHVTWPVRVQVVGRPEPGKPVLAGEIEPGSTITIDRATGVVVKVEKP